MKQNKKIHPYCLTIKNENVTYYVNTYNDAIIELKNNEKPLDFYRTFKRNGFYKSERFFWNKLKKFWLKSYNELNVTISLTENCIFDCVYCSQKDKIKNTKITTQLIDTLLNKLEKHIKKHKIKSCNFFLFGGEPLMCKNELIYLKEQANKKLTKINKTYMFETNGYLLDTNFIEHFKNNSTFYITLSEKEDHDKKRYLKTNKKGTYDTILKNIKELKKLCIPVIIRYNVDSNNIDLFEDFVRFIAYNDYTNQIQCSYTYEFGNSNYKNKLDYFQYKRWATETLPKIFDRYNLVKEELPYMLEPCRAYRKNSFKIMSNGDIRLCNADFSQNNLNIKNVEIEDIWTLQKKYFYNIFEECKKCKFFLLCGGHKKCNEKDCNFTEFDVELYYKQIIGGDNENNQEKNW